MPWDESLVAHRYADLGDVRLHLVEAGSGPLVVLLHGFPEFWYSWRFQLPALAAAGFRVLAPDLRGYNLSDKPHGLRAYVPEVLARDVDRLIRACGTERAAVVGHDWGGLIAWQVAMQSPALVDRLAVLNAPHPVTALRALRGGRQLLRSWYVVAFQLPWLPEACLRAGNFAVLRRVLRTGPARRDAFTAEDIDRYVAALARPGALTAGIDYYRAALRRNPRRALGALRRIDAPVLVIWGERDPYLGRELAAPDPAWAPRARVARIPEASHWVHLDRPEHVNALLLEFLRARAAG